MPGPRGPRLERRELAHAGLRLVVVQVPHAVGDRRAVGGPQVHRVDHVDRVADQREAVALAPQPDQPRGVAGEVDHLEPRDLVALLHGVGDLHRAAVPVAQQPRIDAPAPPHGYPVDVEVVVAAVGLGVRDLVGVAQDRDPEPRRGAAVIGVAVAEHDPLQAAELGRRGRGALRHRLGPGVELGHPAVVLDEVDVHPATQIPGVAPHAFGDPLRGGGEGVPRHRA